MEKIIKIVFIGAIGEKVGKFSLMQRYVNDEWDESDQSSRLGISFFQKTLTHNDQQLQEGEESIKVHIWRAVGNEIPKALSSIYYRNAAAILLVFDITNRETFTVCEHWLQDARNKMTIDPVTGESPVIALIGTKSDLNERRQVPTIEAKQWATNHKINLYFETSSRDNIGVNEAFNEIIRDVLIKELFLFNTTALKKQDQHDQQ